MTNERQGRSVFFGAMVTEGIVALIWAAISMSFFGGVDLLNSSMAASGGNAALVVNQVSNSLLGKIGGVLAILGVVAAHERLVAQDVRYAYVDGRDSPDPDRTRRPRRDEGPAPSGAGPSS